METRFLPIGVDTFDINQLPASFHATAMRAALQVAERCGEVEWYGVGCVIVDFKGGIVASGYTGERRDQDGGLRHAEDVALAKAQSSGIDLKADYLLYSTLEPCSVRASGKTPCTSRIIEAGVKGVLYGAKEPYEPALNIVCGGDEQLRSAGIQVLWLRDYEKKCLASALRKRKGLNS